MIRARTQGTFLCVFQYDLRPHISVIFPGICGEPDAYTAAETWAEDKHAAKHDDCMSKQFVNRKVKATAGNGLCTVGHAACG